MRENLLSRRSLMAGALLAGPLAVAAARPKLKVSVFSKHLHFLQGDDLAKAVAELGFDAVDLTVRKSGHVEPATVARDLPPLVAAIRKHGLEVSMITTEIADADTPFTEDVLKAASALGIRYYRFGAFKWANSPSLDAQIEAFKPRLAKLAALNQKYGMCAIYHTHSGINLVGASIWDLHEIMRDIDPKLVGINYDIGHATVEGGYGGWLASFRISGRHLRGIAVKDFVWAKDEKGAWHEKWCPMGEGMVKLDQFFGLVQATDFEGPLQIHYEYPLGGANNGQRTLTIPREEVFGAMKKDLTRVRASMAKVSL